MGRQVVGRTGGRTGTWADGWTADGRMGRRTSGWVGRWADGWADGWRDGWAGRWVCGQDVFYLPLTAPDADPIHPTPAFDQPNQFSKQKSAVVIYGDHFGPIFVPVEIEI